MMDFVAKPDDAAFQNLAVVQAQMLTGGGMASWRTVVFEDGRYAGQAIKGWTDQRADLVDQTGSQEGPVRRAAALKQQVPYVSIIWPSQSSAKPRSCPSAPAKT